MSSYDPPHDPDQSPPPSGEVPGWGQAPAPSPWGQAPGGYQPSGYDPPPGSWSQHDPSAGQYYQGYQPGYTSPYSRSSQASGALVLSIVGFFCCGLPSVIGMIMGRSEMSAIDRGEADPANRGTAQAAFIIGLIATVLMVASIGLWMLAVFASVASAP